MTARRAKPASVTPKKGPGRPRLDPLGGETVRISISIAPRHRETLSRIMEERDLRDEAAAVRWAIEQAP